MFRRILIATVLYLSSIPAFASSSVNRLTPEQATKKLKKLMRSKCFEREGVEDTIRALLVNADPNVCNGDKAGGLHFAASLGNETLLRLFLGARTRIDALTKDGLSPLMYAVMNKHTSCIVLLVLAGADPNEYRFKRKWEKKYLLQMTNNPEIICLLIALGADPTKKWGPSSRAVRTCSLALQEKCFTDNVCTHPIPCFLFARTNRLNYEGDAKASKELFEKWALKAASKFYVGIANLQWELLPELKRLIAYFVYQIWCDECHCYLELASTSLDGLTNSMSWKADRELMRRYYLEDTSNL